MGFPSVALPSSIQAKIGPPTGIRVGVVTALGSNSLMVNVAGTVLNMPYLDSYSPTIGDNVSVLFYNATWIVLGNASTVETAGGTNAPRGFVDTGHNVTAPTGIGTSAVQILQSDNARTYLNDRAFQIFWRISLSGSAVGAVMEPSILQGSNGTVLRPVQSAEVVATAGNHQFTEDWIFTNSSGADKLDEFISIKLQSTGATTISTQASASAPLFFVVNDIGPASFFPWAATMV